jgi:hypothetical protein
MIKLVDLLKEVQAQPSPEEQEILDDILSLDEAIDFSNVINKVKSYAKKGAINTIILASLLGNSAFGQEQKDKIKDIIKTEKQIDNDAISFEKFKKLIKDEGFKTIPGTMPLNIVKNVKEVKIYRAVGQTQAAALQQAMDQAGNPIRSFSFSRILKNGNIEILIAVSSK